MPSARAFRRGALVALAAVFGGCAVADTGAFPRLQEDMISLKKEVAALRAARGPAPAAPAAAPRPDAREISALQKSVADVSADTDRIKSDVLAAASRADDAKIQMTKEISRLNGKTDEQAQAIGELKAKTARLSDIERRLGALEEKVDKLSAARKTAPLPPAAATEWKTPEEMYDYALGLIVGGKTTAGREVLNAFAAKYPDHRLTPNVHYWKGESFYAEKDYENAILAFQDVVDKFPGGEKASDAMYKQGLSFLALKDPKNARILFELVQTKYPRSQAAEKAKQKLAELK